jgi:hypothetical protein
VDGLTVERREQASSAWQSRKWKKLFTSSEPSTKTSIPIPGEKGRLTVASCVGASGILVTCVTKPDASEARPDPGALSSGAGTAAASGVRMTTPIRAVGLNNKHIMTTTSGTETSSQRSENHIYQEVYLVTHGYLLRDLTVEEYCLRKKGEVVHGVMHWKGNPYVIVERFQKC